MLGWAEKATLSLVGARLRGLFPCGSFYVRARLDCAGIMRGMKKPKKIRLDELLVEQGAFDDAGEVLRAVMAREVRVDDVYVSSAAIKVLPDADIFVKNRKQFVSRGGHKLQGALDSFKQDVRGMRCIDIGSSTGGFTDCLLQAGAASVACIDVNYGQLAMKLRQDVRVTAFERTNIKTADPAELGAPFDLIVIDVSFIGLAQLAPVFGALSRAGERGRSVGDAHVIEDTLAVVGARANGRVPANGDSRADEDARATAGAPFEGGDQPTVFIGLIKPQFESAHEETDRGVVRDEAVRLRTVEEVRVALEENGWEIDGVVESSIKGPKGNVEYLVRALYRG